MRPLAIPQADPEAGTPQSTIEAVLYAVKSRGVDALKESANVERLSRCDGAAKTEIKCRIAKMRATS